MEERNIKLTIAYDGTEFSGYQRQLNTNETIQEYLETAIRKLTGERITITGAGRTDAGVHAAAQVVNFRTKSTIPIEKWPYALRGLLPKSIVAYRAELVSKEFHARYSAQGKTYLYRICREPWPSVFKQRFAYHYPGELDEKAIHSVLPLFMGEHDFISFAAKGSSVSDTVRILSRLEIQLIDDEWLIWITANGFLYHMVRNIVGALLWVGEKKLTYEDMRKALQEKKKVVLGPTVPAIGLTLMEVEYKDEQA